MLNKQQILDVLKDVQDPEMPTSILELDMVNEDDITIVSDNKVKLTFKPTSEMCPMGSIIGVLIKKKLKDALGVDAEVKVRPGTHMNEEMVNDIINSKAKYEQIVKRLEDAGIC
jgi:ATP-binding protein involved in chromosome partitioning